MIVGHGEPNHVLPEAGVGVRRETYHRLGPCSITEIPRVGDDNPLNCSGFPGVERDHFPLLNHFRVNFEGGPRFYGCVKCRDAPGQGHRANQQRKKKRKTWAVAVHERNLSTVPF